VTLAAGAAIFATPVAAPLAASAASSHPGVSKAEIAAKAAAPRPTPTDLLSYGDTGEAVAAVQAQLRIVADGIFGPQTEGAVKQFQIAHNLGATGIVDTRTWAELFRVQVKYFGESSSGGHTVLAATGTQPASSSHSRPSSSTGGPDLSDRADLRGEVESSAPSTGSEPAPAAAPAPAPAPAPVQSTPVSTSGSGGCTSDGRIVTPVSNGTVTSPYGDDRGDHIHSGEDIAAPTGTTVRAANCGTVSISGTESGYGQMVCIQHAGATTTCYAHLSERDVAVNDYVKAGQKIGEVGCTGNCTGPHVHFEVRLDGKATDPAPYLSGAKTVQGQSVPATTAALPAGQGGTGGPSAAEETAVWGDATGGTTAPAPGAQPAAAMAPQPAATTATTAPQPAAATAPQPAAETAPAATAPQPAAETAPAATAPQPAATTAPQPAAETAPQPAVETAPAATAPQPAAATAPAVPEVQATAQVGAAAAPAEAAPQPAETAPAQPAPAPQPAETAPAQPAPAPQPAETAPAQPAPAAPADQAPAPTAEPSAPAAQAPAADGSAVGAGAWSAGAA